MPSNAVTVTATYKDAPTATYLLTVVSGTGGGTYTAGTQVSIMADTPAQGKVFDGWTTSNGGSFGDANSVSTTFTMPSNTVTVTATYKDAPVETYTLTVSGSYAETSGAGQYAPGTQVSINAGSRSNYSFTGWTTSSDGSFANAASASTTFIMPNGNVTVTANWKYYGGGSDSFYFVGSPTTPITTLPEKRPGQPVTVAATVTPTTEANGTANTVIPGNVITDAITKAQSDAKAQGKMKNGIAVEVDATMSKSVTSLAVTLTQNSLNSLVNAGVKSFKINGYPVKISFDNKALTEIQKQSSGNVTITIKPVQDLTTETKKLIGTRPVYDITVRYVKDGKTIAISEFNGGIATIYIFYRPGKNEAVGYLYGVYVDAKGSATRINSSTYDTNEGVILIPTGHLLIHGVGYTEPSARFTDIGTHWGKESIDYVVGRGLISGTSENTFEPNTAMSRAVLVTALGRLTGTDVSSYKQSSFTDVTVDKYYAPYIEWAYVNGIIKGIGNSQFAPDRAVTREEIALIFANYAKVTGYKLPVTREETTYEDASTIGRLYRTAVTAMQQAGIMMGDQNNKFYPKASATRAEVSAMLHRYVKLTINSATAQGFVLNDEGQWFYYKDGKALTEDQTINGVKYYFYNSGALQTGWVKVGDKWNFYSGTRMLIGWWNIESNDGPKTYYFDTYGNMTAEKWLEIGSKWYYFNTDGSLAKSTTIDGYEVDENGARKMK